MCFASRKLMSLPHSMNHFQDINWFFGVSSPLSKIDSSETLGFGGRNYDEPEWLSIIMTS